MQSQHFEALYPDTSRFEEIEKVAQFLKSGNSCQIVGMPGVGRGNIVGLLTYNHAIREKHLGHLSTWFHFVMVNFSEVRNKPLYEVTKLMFLELVDSLRERGMQDEYESVSTIFKDALSYTDELVLFQGLKKAIDFLSIEKEHTIIFLFERFETYIPMVTADFFNNLRVLRNRAKYRFSVVFSLTRPLEDLIEPTLASDFYELLAGHTVYVSLYDKPGFAFRLQYLEKVSDKSIDPELIKKILSLTSGHGKLTKVCIEKCLQENVAAKDITREFLLSSPTVQGTLFEIWSFLTPAEQEMLKEIATLPLVARNDGFLENIGLVKNDTITIPLFEDFVHEHMKKEIDASMYFDETTNTIKKGSQILSDSLTGAEFRLLRLLLSNKDRVIERDEIIAAVWQDAASTAGVSDQAIDQLIFRLRRKIEPDPNHPILLLTIKGRGIKMQNI